jgi:hypothetical protein
VPSWVSTLFEAPLEEFIARRNELAKAAKDPEEAKRIKAFRKPSKALWLVNDVARREPAQVKALIAATDRVRKAQEKAASGDELREAMREQRQALSALTAAAGDDSVERRVHDTLQAAAMQDPAALREARIEEELQPAGFDAVFGLEIAPRPAHGHAATDAKGGAHGGGKSHAAHGGGKGAKATKAAAKHEAEERKAREHELRSAQKEAERLEAHAKKLEAAAEHADREAAKAEEAAAAAQRAAEAAREKAAKAGGEARSARSEAGAAQLRATRLGGKP